MQPPKDAKEIFMGGGIIGSDVVKMGVFGTPEELFDQREYRHGEITEAKSVRKYYAYYDSKKLNPIGFSKTPTIYLHKGDTCNIHGETKLSALTSGNRIGTLFRCGSSNLLDQNDFGDTFQIVFYYRI